MKIYTYKEAIAKIVEEHNLGNDKIEIFPCDYGWKEIEENKWMEEHNG